MQMIFLLPLFAVFMPNSMSIEKTGVRPGICSSSGVSFIPIFCKIIETIYDIIPKLLKKIIITRSLKSLRFGLPRHCSRGSCRSFPDLHLSEKLFREAGNAESQRSASNAGNICLPDHKHVPSAGLFSLNRAVIAIT
jgi:hypothetical protein